MSPKQVFERLPTKLIPVNYNLTLAPDFEKFTFQGTAIIEVKVQEATNEVCLNANEIELLHDQDNVCHALQNGKNPVTSIEYEKENEIVKITFTKPLELGEARLVLHYRGILNDQLKGFYRSKYTGADSVDRYIAVTQFEATDARRAFPCWDEPAHKATFDITLVADNNPKLAILSNQPEVGRTPTPEGRVAVSFKRTPIMSTYLLAFVVGELEFVETKTSDGIVVRVYTPPGKVDKAQFALETCAKGLDYYRDYFGIPYPLEKMDLVALPDFASGAMENWGLVTYREVCILVDPLDSSQARMQNVALVVTHELAHQWFGNLVTMEWWTHLWLNEGFATFMEYLCTDALYPHFDIWSQFLTDVHASAMNLDGLENSHPIEVPVGHPSEVDEIFDRISYEKGSASIRMLYEHIGDANFRKGMSAYLKKHSYKNTQTEDLWEALSEASGQPIDKMMTSWTKLKGFPVLTVKEVARQPGKLELQLTQQKFSYTGHLSNEDRQSSWVVPLAIISEASPKKAIIQQLMTDKTINITLHLPQESNWFKLNPNSVALYRVVYTPRQLEALSAGVRNGTLAASERAGVLTDFNALVRAGQQPSVELMKFVQSFGQEHDYSVWIILNSILAKFSNLLAEEPDLQQKWHRLGRELLNKGIFPKLGWEKRADESNLDTLLRPIIIGRLVSFGDEQVIAKCRKMFEDHFEEKKFIPADLRALVYKAVISSGGEKEYDQLIKLYRASDFQEEKSRLSQSLGFTKDKNLMQKTLDFSLSAEIRSQDTAWVMATVASNLPVGRDLTWNFFKRNRDLFWSRYGSGSILPRMMNFILESFNDIAMAVEIEQFFEASPMPCTERAVKQAVEMVRLNAELLARDLEAIRKYLNSA